MKKKDIETIKLFGIVAVVLIAAVVMIGIGGPAQQAVGTNKPTQGAQTQGIGAAVNSGNGTTGNGAVAPESGANTSAVESNTSAQQESSCKQNSVYFIYADWCPHCQKMKPWVTDLESQGYKFVKTSSDNVDSVRGCLAGIGQMQYIPEFVCISNKQDHVGEFTDENAMKAFADACGTGPQ